MKLNTPISEISYVGPKYSKSFQKAGIKNLKDLLFYFPRDYEDRSEITYINKVQPNKKYLIQAKILMIKSYRSPHKKMHVTKSIVEDKTGAIQVIWFNQPFVSKQLKKAYLASFIGPVKSSSTGLVLSNPQYEIISRGQQTKLAYQHKDLIHSHRIVPIYREPAGLTSKYLRFLIWFHLKKLEKIRDFLPQEIIKRNDFIPIETALKEIHFPSSWASLKKAKIRLAFNELFLIMLYLEREKELRKAHQKAYAIPFNQQLVQSFIYSLPFQLTLDQKKATWQTVKDLEKDYPTQRLLEGDVGSGKTIVAAIASLSVAATNYQTAIMAPTEVLARQHFQQFSKMLRKTKIDVAMLIGAEARIYDSQKSRAKKISKQKLLEALATGKIKIVIGTHALIQKKVKFKNLAFVVIDEQHRFGVGQRAELLRSEKYEVKGTKEKEAPLDSRPQTSNFRLRTSDFGLQTSFLRPHMLSMSATPIPRTLSLVFYGDLNISRLKELPKGRKKIITQIVLPHERDQVYSFIRKEIKKGRQAFVICPLIEESEKLQARAVREEFKKLSKNIFQEFTLALLHGRMKSQDKKKIMDDFLANKINILVATSVIEVGIDVPNATIMLIEGAERFGLAQLHQLRGRVGRSSYQSYCFLLTDLPSQKVTARLKALIASEDGFELAEKDLEIRGPGDFIGKRQAGLPDLVMASFQDVKLINLARKESGWILKKDLSLKTFPLLKKILRYMANKIHLE